MTDATLQLPDRAIPARIADDFATAARGYIARDAPEWALVFPLAGRQVFHMLGVRFPIGLAEIEDGVVARTTRLRPWVGITTAEGEYAIEYPSERYTLPLGAAVEVDP